MSTNPIDQRIGDRLRCVRESLGLTLQRVSQIVEFNTYQTLLSIEKGTRPVKASELARLCKLYCKDSWHFLREDEPEEQPLVCAWRSAQETKNRALIEAQVLGLARNYQLLEEVTGEKCAPDLEPWPKEPDLTFQRVAEKAREFLLKWDLGARPAACLHEILVDKLRVKIINYDLHDAGSALTAEGDFGLVIALNTSEVLWRKNFSLAHELFHLLSRNHYRLEEIHREVTGESLEKPRYERYADTFAASLLMPDSFVVHELKKRLSDDNRIEWVDLVGIAMEFGVSTEAMLWRLKRLGRLTADQVEQLLGSAVFRSMDQSSRTDKREPGLEYSKRMVWLGLKALRLGKISKGKFCQIFKTTRAEFDTFLSLYGDLEYDENNTDFDIEPIELISRDENADGLAMA